MSVNISKVRCGRPYFYVGDPWLWCHRLNRGVLSECPRGKRISDLNATLGEKKGQKETKLKALEVKSGRSKGLKVQRFEGGAEVKADFYLLIHFIPLCDNLDFNLVTFIS
jgi:hypothetical protein